MLVHKYMDRNAILATKRSAEVNLSILFHARGSTLAFKPRVHITRSPKGKETNYVDSIYGFSVSIHRVGNIDTDQKLS